MKISKLFHWLYASLMLLPLLVFVPSAFYYGFNEHAVAQEKYEYQNYKNTNDVYSLNDLHLNYYYTYLNNINYPNDSNLTYNIINLYLDENSFNENVDTTYNCILYIPSGDAIPRIAYKLVNESTIRYKLLTGTTFSFKLSAIRDYASILIEHIGSYQNIIISETNMSITDSMSYAWDSVWQNDLFSWSYGSFLTEPFIYIGNVFNVPVDNTLYYALSYWLDISIIWLTFDLVMYIPLLVHRWLDKGIIE